MARMYGRTHLWMEKDSENERIARIGLSAYALGELGEVAYAEPPEHGRVYERGEVFCVLETTKKIEELRMPFKGMRVSGRNEDSDIELTDALNRSWETPLGEFQLLESIDENGWMDESSYFEWTGNGRG